MYADGCKLVPLSEAGKHLKPKAWLGSPTRRAFETYERLLYGKTHQSDFDAYVLKASAGAETWLLIHGLRGDIFGGFTLSPDRLNPIEAVALYWYPGYSHNWWEGNLLILEHLARRLLAMQATTPTAIYWPKLHLLWGMRQNQYDPYFKIPPQLQKRLVLLHGKERLAA